MRIALQNGFSDAGIFSVRNVHEGMRTIAEYMAKNDLKDCTAYELRNGETCGKGWRIWRTSEYYYYHVNHSQRKNVRIASKEELLC